jgi:hypothetical protein
MTKSVFLTATLCASAFALVACDSTSDAASDMLSDAVAGAFVEDPARDVAALLKSDDPKACAHDASIKLALAAAYPAYETYLGNGGPPSTVDTISVRKIDPTIHEITCSGLVRTTFRGRDQSAQLIFKLRPSLDDGGGFQVESLRSRDVASNMLLQDLDHREEKKAAEAESASFAAGAEADTEIAPPVAQRPMTLPVRQDQPSERYSEYQRSEEATRAADPADAPAAPSAAAPAEEAPSFR